MKAKPWLSKAEATYTSLLDRDTKLATHFGVKYIPFYVLLDERGKVVQPPRLAEVGDKSQRDSIATWLEHGGVALPTQREAATTDSSKAEIELRCALAALYLQNQEIDQAVIQLKRALRRDPDNWLVRKQIWAIEHPEKFYEGNVDFGWQRDQLRADRTTEEAETNR